MIRHLLTFLLLLIANVAASPTDDFTKDITALFSERKLKGMQVQVSADKKIAFNLNLG